MLLGLKWREKRLRNIARRLTHFDLQKSDAKDDLSSSEMDSYLFGRLRTSSMFLNYYTRQGLIEALERYGTLGRLRDRGFQPYLTLKKLDADRNMLRIRNREKGPILIELVCRYANISVRQARNDLVAGDSFKLLAIEWLLLQNPFKSFEDRRPCLPGQQFPGLGIGREVLILLEIMAERLEQEGLLAFPEHYHNGFLYDRKFRYFSPQKEGELKALERDLADLSLAEASWAVHEKLVINGETGKALEWRGEEMILPLSQRLKEYFQSDYYLSEMEQTSLKMSFFYNYEALTELLKRFPKK